MAKWIYRRATDEMSDSNFGTASVVCRSIKPWGVFQGLLAKWGPILWVTVDLNCELPNMQ